MLFAHQVIGIPVTLFPFVLFEDHPKKPGHILLAFFKMLESKPRVLL